LNLNEPEKLTEILSSAGVKEIDEVVIVFGKGLSKEAALAFIMMEKLGQKKVSVFIDSMEKWTQLGYTVIKDSAKTDLEKSADELKITSNAYPSNFLKDIIINDINDTQGLYPQVYIASGEITPLNVADNKVVHLPYYNLVNEDGTLNAAKDIWSIIDKAGVPRYGEIICFSDDPGEAAVNYFIFKLMGYPDLKVWLNN